MQHRDFYSHEILQDVINKSYAKSQGQWKMLAILSFLGGGYVSFGYMTYLKVVSGISADWAGLANLFEAAFVGVSYLYVYRHMLKEDYVI